MLLAILLLLASPAAADTLVVKAAVACENYETLATLARATTDEQVRRILLEHAIAGDCAALEPGDDVVVIDRKWTIWRFTTTKHPQPLWAPIEAFVAP